MTHADVFEFLRGRRLAAVSSVSREGAPESAVVGIAVTRDLEIVFDTVKTSRKYGNLIANPAAAVVAWSGERTVQYQGLTREPEGAELDRYREIYFETFPDGRDRLAWPGITHFVIRPTWIRYCDFSARPPVMEEFSF
ncbi:MAG TPA: pyridoxamine 5'-phosphate oxidase family protein [Bryobacteraceae bacterium]|jgi:pyridoxine/pyridoxamine 5'-phosphate oxidase|nr:pyridoxamine 5'-phosphate oxidase family protein [Bryobacteraceae bacterium]